MTDFDQKHRLEKVRYELDYSEAMQLIYEWVKTSVINKRQFTQLIEAIHD